MLARDEIISYVDMCLREGMSFQKGMNFGAGDGHSVLLMTLRGNAPYEDRIEDDGTTLIYEGHDIPRRRDIDDPKIVDQPESNVSGSLTENGKFHKATQDCRQGRRAPERVRVYEKLNVGIWSYSGLFHLVDSWTESDGKRNVFKFKLVPIDEDIPISESTPLPEKRQRMIPTAIKLTVWKRDRGRCVVCGATDELHFDHVIPFSKGGTSLSADNVQLLCARHNLTKSDKIQ